MSGAEVLEPGDIKDPVRELEHFRLPHRSVAWEVEEDVCHYCSSLNTLQPGMSVEA